MAGLAAGLRPEAVFALSEPGRARGPARRIRTPAGRRSRLRRRPARRRQALDPRIAGRAHGRLRRARGAAARRAALAGARRRGPGRRPAATRPRRALPAGSRRLAPNLVVYADRLADPGNLGTLVRAAAAFAAAALVASPGLGRSVLAQGRACRHGRRLRPAALPGHAARAGRRRAQRRPGLRPRGPRRPPLDRSWRRGVPMAGARTAPRRPDARPARRRRRARRPVRRGAAPASPISHHPAGRSHRRAG